MSPKVQYICFSDNPNLRCRGWEVRPLPLMSELGNGNLANRFCKFFPWKILPEHHWSIYIDANIRLLTDPSPIISEAEGVGADLVISKHPQRTCIWEEAEACKRLNKFTDLDLAVINAQLARYESRGMPMNFGVTANGIIFRSGQSLRLLPIMEKWWVEFSEGVKRDQISLPFVLWMTGTQIHKLPFYVWDLNPYFRIVPHRRNASLFARLQAHQYHCKLYKLFLKYFNFGRRLALIFRRALSREGPQS